MDVLLPEPFASAPALASSEILVRRDSLLFRCGQPTRGLHFLAAGSAELRRVTPGGDVVVIHRARQGETFAEASLFADTYHCDALATSDCRFIVLDRNYVLGAISGNAAFALELMRSFALQMQEYRRRLELLAIRNAEDRVFAAIQAGLLVQDIRTLAAEISLTHESVYRALARLVAAGRLRKTERGRYAIRS